MTAGTKYSAFFLVLLLCIVFCNCQKELGENKTAKGSLKDASGVCFDQVIHGTFYNGITPGIDTAFLEVKVNVTSTGNYAIFTNQQNGLRFTDSGYFKNTGITTVRLKPSGTAVDSVLTGFSVFFDTSVCTFSIKVHDSSELHPKDTLNNNWKFTDAETGITYKGLFVKNYVLNLGTLQVLVLATREAERPGDSTFMINIGLPSGVVEPGNYSTDDEPTGIVFKTFSDACLNCAGGGLIPLSSGATVIITIDSYNDSTKIVKGRFSGTTVDWNNEVSEIKDGAFSAELK